MPNQVRVGFGITGVSKAEGDLDRLKNKLTGIQNAGAKGVLKGVGLGIGIGVVNAATTSLFRLGDAIGDATQAAIADEASQQQLTTTLKAAIPAWDGNTTAIEKVLDARIKLGFSDDEQRESLATLVTATGDVKTALDLERGAMDLARKANVSLETASDAVAKAFGGQDKQLRTLLPGLEKGKTNMDTLANAFDAAEGQASDYSKTMGGKVLVAQTKMNEAMERFGYVTAGPAADGLTAFVDALESAGRGMELFAGDVTAVGTAFDKEFVTPIAAAGTAVHDFMNGASDDFDKFDADVDRASGKVHRLMTNLKGLSKTPVYTSAPPGAPHRASGGPASGMTWVGEQGPELVDLPSGSNVHSAAESARMGGDNFYLTFTGSIGQGPDNIIAQVNRMRYYSRARKAA